MERDCVGRLWLFMYGQAEIVRQCKMIGDTTTWSVRQYAGTKWKHCVLNFDFAMEHQPSQVGLDA